MHPWISRHGLNFLAIIALLVGAFGAGLLPYSYYQFMNWTVAGAASIIAWRAHGEGRVWRTWLFIAMGVTFNPLAPIYLAQTTWKVIDLAAALLLLGIVFFGTDNEGRTKAVRRK